jgi:hypothetical protein
MAKITTVMFLSPKTVSPYAWAREAEIHKLEKLIAMGDKPFYTADACLCGGEINSLHLNNWVKKTGNTKKMVITIQNPVYRYEETSWGGKWPVFDHNEPLEKEVEVFEWQITNFPRAFELLGYIKQMHEVLKGE